MYFVTDACLLLLCIFGMRGILVSKKYRGIKSDGIMYSGFAKHRGIPSGGTDYPRDEICNRANKQRHSKLSIQTKYTKTTILHYGGIVK